MLNARRRRAVKLREAGVTVREATRQYELSTHTVVDAHMAFRRGSWAVVKVKRTGRAQGLGPPAFGRAKAPSPVADPGPHSRPVEDELCLVDSPGGQRVDRSALRRWKVFSSALNAMILIRFLERLARQQQRRIFLILDNLRVHHSKHLREWLQANADKIEVFYLPSYSPELNPYELLNADLKHRVTSAAPARN